MRCPEVVARFSRCHAPWLWAGTGAPGGRPGGWVLLAAVGVFVLNWGAGLMRAVLFLSDRWPAFMICAVPRVVGAAPGFGDVRHGCTAPSGWGAWLGPSSSTLTDSLWVLLACLLLMRLLGVPGEGIAGPRQRRGWVLEAIAVAGWFTALLFTALARVLTAGNTSPAPSQTGDSLRVVQVVATGLGGAVEEAWFGPVAVVAMRRLGMPWWAVLSTAGVLRASFHVYYGAPVWGHLLWGVAAAALYALTGRWWGMFLAHLLVDVTVTAHEVGLAAVERTADNLLTVMIAAAFAVGVVGVRRGWVAAGPARSG